MELSQTSIFLRLAATSAEMTDDAKNGRFISPFSRTSFWSKQQSDRVFERITNMLLTKGLTLENV